MTWKDTFTFGQHEGKTIIYVLSTHKAYLKWCFSNKLEEKYPELQFILDNIKPHELAFIMKQ